MDVVDTIPVVGPVVGAGKDLAEFVETGFGRRILMDTPHMKAVLVAFLPGQRIPDHAPAVDLAVSVLEGDGRVRIDDQEFGVRAGDVAMIPAGAARSITAGWWPSTWSLRPRLRPTTPRPNHRYREMPRPFQGGT